MSNEVGSMDVVMNYKDNGFQAGMAKAKQWLLETKNTGKSLNTEMTRLGAAALATGVIIAGLGKKLKNMFTTALADSPFLIGAITRMKTIFQLLGWEITSVLQPAFDWMANKLSDLYNWFTNLSPIVKDIVSWVTILGTMAAAAAVGIVTLGLTLTALGLPTLLTALTSIATWIGIMGAAFVSSTAFIIATGIALGTVVGLLGVMALDELGVLDWVAKMGEKFKNWVGETSLLYDAFVLLLSPLAIFGDAILVLVTDKTMEHFWKDIDKITNSANNMRKALGFKVDTGFFSGGQVGDSGGFGGSYATGLLVPSDGRYNLHAGETVNPAGISKAKSGTASIVVDFGNSVFNMASGLDIEQLAAAVSGAIAEKQAWEAY